jgi:hypothetical protein
MTKLFRTLDKYPTYLVGLTQGLSVAVYIALFALVVIAMQDMKPQPAEVLGVIVSLLLFVVSALVCGLLVLGYPIVLALRGKIQRAVWTIVYSGLSLALILFVAGLFILL